MKIQRAAFLGVRGVPDGAHELAGPSGEGDLVLVTGSRGAGKTRFLEALIAAKEALAPYDTLVVGAPWIGRDDGLAKVMLTLRLDEEEQAYACVTRAELPADVQFLPHTTASSADDGVHAVLDRYEHGQKTGKVEYFPASRQLPRFGPFASSDVLTQRRLRARADERKYSFVGPLLRRLPGAPQQAAAFDARLAALSRTVRRVPVQGEDEVPRCFSSRGGPPVGWLDLSAGERDAILFAATAVAIDLDNSIVFVDRPELHVAPADAPALLAGLRALGKGNQLFVATSSPALLATKGAVVVDLDRADTGSPPPGVGAA